MKKIFTLLLVSSGLFFSASAQRLLNEDFNYAAGQLTAASGGANVSNGVWTGFSGTGKFIPVVEGSLTYPNYSSNPTTDSRHILLDTASGSAEDAYANFEAQTTGTVYISFLISVLDTVKLVEHSSDTSEYFIAMLPSTSTSTYFARLFIRKGSVDNTVNLGIAAQGYSSTPVSWVSADLPINTTHLVTMAYEKKDGANNDEAKLWVNEPFTANEPAAQASSVFLIGSESSNTGRMAFRQSFSSNLRSTPKCRIDAIKISKTWADATLPVTLKSFTASYQNGNIGLSWSTVNEINMKAYQVERSVDAKNFVTIGTVVARNSGNENNYSYLDLKTLNGTSYYRLKMVDMDGSYRYSTIIAGSAKILQQLTVLGGVVNNNLIISHAVSGNGAMLKILSMNGNAVAVHNIQSGVSQTILNVSSLASGNYIAVYLNGNEKQSVQFVKQ